MLTAAAGLPSEAGAAALFSPFDLRSRRAVVAAVSGGSDSTALLLLLRAHLARAAPAVRLLAVTVDHRLRPESAGEADAVAALCRGLGVEHRTLFWEGAKPSAGLPAAARLARYRLLARAAGEAGTDLMITGHTADDQAETVAMRRARGGGRGLAGMAPATLFEGCTWILRPLLGVRRARLRAMLEARGLGWIDDPTNGDSRFERSRMRASLAARESDVTEALRLAARAANDRMELGRRAAALIDRTIRVPPEAVWFGFHKSGDRSAALYAFRILLSVVGGKPQLPDRPRSEHLFENLARQTCDASLAGCLVARRERDAVLLPDRRGRFGPAERLRLAPWATFLPSFDLAPARAVAALIGASPPPAPPFAASSPGHIRG